MQNLSSERDETEALAAEVLELLAKATERFEAEDNEHWRWIAEHSPVPQVVEILHGSTTTTLRILDAIGRLEPVNGVTVSTQYRTPKGTVSKVTRRLIAQGLVSTESLPNNRKEVLFRLTPLGRAVFDVHHDFDAQMERGFRQFLRRYDASDLRFLVRLLREVSETSFLTLGLQEASMQAGPTGEQRRRGNARSRRA
jgi:DNA-binding MarR family transcriptional regulator